MNNKDLIQSILLACEKEAGDPFSSDQLRDFANTIIGMVADDGAVTVMLPREDGISQLKFEKPLIILDLETSDKEIDKAYIIEFAAIKIYPDGNKENLAMLINPGFDISSEIEDLTHIKNEDLEGALDLRHYAEAIRDFIGEGYVCGYNVRNFDGPVLVESLARIGMHIQIQQENILDVMEMFFKVQPRNLAAAVTKYAGRGHTDAHRAMPDVVACHDVLVGMLATHPELPANVQDLVAATRKDFRLDMAGYIAINADGVPCFTFGKHKDQPCASQRGYLKWMISQGSFPENTKAVVDAILG